MKDFLKKTFGGGSTPGRRFEGKTVVVTGASSGIGLATALAFAREGAKVALIARRANEGAQALEQVQKLGAEGMFIQADVSNSAQVRDAFAKIAAQFGRLEAAFNNAGVQQEMGPTTDLEEAEFDRVMQINAKGTWLCMREEITAMQDRGGAIVNMSSISGFRPNVNFSAYVASKHAVTGLTRAAALECADRGIRINVVCPGYVRTDMTSGVDEAWIKKRIPFKRWIEPREISEAVLFLCSDAAEAIIGQELVVDGGVTLRSW